MDNPIIIILAILIVTGLVAYLLNKLIYKKEKPIKKTEEEIARENTESIIVNPNKKR